MCLVRWDPHNHKRSPNSTLFRQSFLLPVPSHKHKRRINSTLFRRSFRLLIHPHKLRRRPNSTLFCQSFLLLIPSHKHRRPNSTLFRQSFLLLIPLSANHILPLPLSRRHLWLSSSPSSTLGLNPKRHQNFKYSSTHPIPQGPCRTSLSRLPRPFRFPGTFLGKLRNYH